MQSLPTMAQIQPYWPYIVMAFNGLIAGWIASSVLGGSGLLTNTIVKELGIKPKLVATGAMSASRTQVMSGQTDTAWSGFPSNLGIIRSGEARIIGTGDDAQSLRGITIRVTAANTNWLAKNRDVATRFLRALWKGQQYNFSGPAAFHTAINLRNPRETPE